MDGLVLQVVSPNFHDVNIKLYYRCRTLEERVHSFFYIYISTAVGTAHLIIDYYHLYYYLVNTSQPPS